MILASASPASVTLTLAATAAYLLAALGPHRMRPKSARTAVLVAWLIHGGLLAWGLFGSAPGHEPRFGFAPALSVTAWLVAAIYAVESQVYPQLQMRWPLSAVCISAITLGLIFPGNLLGTTTSPWLPLHWALGIASYGLFGVAVVHAWLMTRSEESIRLASEPHIGLPLLTLERLTFRFIEAGFALLSATLLIAVLFGASLYGTDTSWKWDHKTVFSVLSWLTFAILLIGRAQFGWRGRRAVRVLYAGAALLLLAYVGSRFVMEIMLGRSA